MLWFRFVETVIQLDLIFLQQILAGFFMDFPTAVRQTTEPICQAAVEIYGRMSTDLLPTPAKSHYVFNLRDLSKCIQGWFKLIKFDFL